LHRYLLQQCAWPAVISDTRQAAKQISRSPVKLVPNGVDLDQFSGRFSRPPGKKIVFLGRFHPQKGLDILLPAFAKVLTKHAQARLILIGDGTEKPLVKRLISRLDLAAHVELPGQMTGKRLIKTLQTANIFVLPSRFEGQAISLLLAMAAELPVVATKVGDNQQLIKDGQTGYLVEPENINQLARALIDLLDSPRQAVKMGQAGRQLVKNQYTWDKISQKLINAYRQALAI
jgi:glycosyltransferase involved in cell wall biosynthesis